MRKFILLLSVLASIEVHPQFFTKIMSGQLVNTPGDSRSVNWVDVNNDGNIDCFISNGPSGGQNNSLFLNDGAGNFAAILNDSIVLDGKPSDGATFGDIDNNGSLDAFVVNWYNVNNLYYENNGSGQFTKINSQIISNDLGYSETAAWGDYDNDGYLDLYVTNSAGAKKNYLYKNNGNNTFTKITSGAHVNDAFASRSVNWTDMDNDGDVDLFITNEGSQNENIYRNDGNGNFTKLTVGALLNNAASTMSGSWGDYDNDGDLDVFLCNEGSFNSLFRNDGNFNFTKINTDTVVKTPSRSLSSAWSDIDNDGDLDLFVTNAFAPTTVKLPNFFYLNNGDGTFSKNSSEILALDSAWSYGCAFGDYDNDGFEDLAVATCRFAGVDKNDFLYHNNGNTNKWITIKLTGTISNKSAIGTKVRVKAIINGATVWQMREISSQSSYCGQNDMRAHFGLGNASAIDSVRIEWPSGIVETYTNVNVNQFLNYTEGPGVFVKKNEKFNNELTVFPNPSVGLVTIQLSSGEFRSTDKFSVINSEGKTVYAFAGHASKHLVMDTKRIGLLPGNYMVIMNREEKKVSCKLIISQN